jgi:hypothetical protein
MFLGFVWLMVCVAGAILAGSTVMATTHLTAAINDTATTIPVADTTGFADTGTIVFNNGERITYASTTANTFKGNPAFPLVRGASGTTATAHVSGEQVRTVESSMLNNSMGYNLAVLSDYSGLMYFISAPFAIFGLLTNFFVLPLSFLGTDLQIITYIWGVIGLGMIISMLVSLIGGRRTPI